VQQAYNSAADFDTELKRLKESQLYPKMDEGKEHDALEDAKFNMRLHAFCKKIRYALNKGYSQ
jgi:hypothetical protein